MQPAASVDFETPRAAATLVLLREATTGPEVLLLRRHAKASNMAGVYVFPGGKLDAEDATLNPDTHLDQPHAALHEGLNEPGTDSATAAGLYVAALREALEECGLLLAEPWAGAPPLDAARARAMLREGQPFAQVLAALQLRLQTRQLAPWSRWITPLAPSMGTRRFDTRFFVAQAPAGQTARHDDEETTDSVWLAPRKALEQYRDGAIDLAPPQIMSLAHLARHASVASVLSAARSQRPPLILPEPFDHDGVRVLCYPGDAMHPVRERALPGPTRLHYRERRFTPEAGFEALFD
ncbi:NUDIX hydrolase [Acidovorax sp. JHL-9]|uniref:NUDIX hydrolase n=1 Tax=Acidovorax sp. JHL-9 TaxID=1276756 RepID=UPI00042403B2|nr:NUDIX hydrolase [Acidovorax sp. JHL-9]